MLYVQPRFQWSQKLCHGIHSWSRHSSRCCTRDWKSHCHLSLRNFSLMMAWRFSRISSAEGVNCWVSASVMAHLSKKRAFHIQSECHIDRASLFPMCHLLKVGKFFVLHDVGARAHGHQHGMSIFLLPLLQWQCRSRFYLEGRWKEWDHEIPSHNDCQTSNVTQPIQSYKIRRFWLLSSWEAQHHLLKNIFSDIFFYILRDI